ncbi:helix-turn-helix domain-containing protein [Heyndrickxia ginsengihumi]|uniref:helix-turn-helix domain-containing protein n=1 Tax=Heyndrickxia ginsengihumi TaxID=363870 RepID=UPI003D2589AA
MYSVKPRLLEILKERDMTQTELSNLSNVPQSAISRFDKNKQHMDQHLVAISKALDLNIEDLFYIEETEESEA